MVNRRGIRVGPGRAVDSRTPVSAQSFSNSPSPYLAVLNKYFPTQILTKLENKVKRKTVRALRALNMRIQEAQVRRRQLVKDSKVLQKERFQVETESKCFLKYLAKTNNHFIRKHEELWKDYAQEREVIEQKKQELASRFATRTADLQAQFFQGKKILYDLKQALLALRDISLLKERQEMTLLELQQEKEKVESETIMKDQEAHFQFLQQKALLEKQLNELDRLQKGDTRTRELKGKAKAWELLVQQAHHDFCLDFIKENQQLLESFYQLHQEFKKLEDIRSQLIRQRQHQKEERWYEEALTRGWQRLQAKYEHNGCPKEQGAPKSAPSHP
ncbi:coiled-coil domain-containing protein 121 [Perognathus longimembris pacificus]|uniref:coiled-coil domain-containing protein 121 n=1 Tax=Perognathus longimembris pacificus TaxID=214514 RepID=UPI0020196F66|nr:coiled-coil domain-containing protein 121 [Perognathus longimembris pacificus]